MPVKPVVRKNKAIPRNPPLQQAWKDFSSPFKKILDGLVYLMAHFSRYGQDIVCLLLTLFSLLCLLAVFHITEGSLLNPLADFLERWFGWGAPVLIVGTGMLAVTGFRWSKLRGGFLMRVVIVEAFIFSLIAFMSSLSGYSVEKADAGEYGGLLGWGLAELLREHLGDFLSGAVWFAMMAIFAAIAVHLFKKPSPKPMDLQSGGQNQVKKVDLVRQTAEPQMELPFVETTAREPEPIKPPASRRQPEPPPRLQPLKSTPGQIESVPIRSPRKQTSLASDDLKIGSPSGGRLKNLGAMSIPSVQPSDNMDLKATLPSKRDGILPPLSLLQDEEVIRLDETNINQSAAILEKTLMDFGVPARVIGYRMGPTVTQFAVEPGYIEKPAPDGRVLRQKVRVNQISGLSRDLALALSSTSIRIEAPVPGRSYVGVEIPNIRTITVRLKPLFESEKFNKSTAPLMLALGRDVSGAPLVADLGRMPHLLIAGTTGSGKSVCIEAITTCLAMNNSPKDLRLVMIDPKMVELVRFNGLPHLIGKVETNLERVEGVLKWVIAEMDQRYKKFAEVHARDLDAYNQRMEKRGEDTLPRIVLIIDELADLMMTAPTQIEPAIVRLAQLARATGIHLVVATQRPSTDVVTGLIKANFPARLAFAVTSNTDSRVILDSPGAENLLGHGDMLFLDPEAGIPIRAQGVYVSDDEIERVIQHWQKEVPDLTESDAPWEAILNEEEDSSDQLIKQAIEVIKQTGKASASLLQRRLRIGYPRAASLMDELEDMGIVGPSEGAGRDREVFILADEPAEGESV